MATEQQTGYTALMRAFETAYAAGDCGEQLVALSRAIAASVLKKLVDPQRTAATERETVSNSGYNAAIVAMRRGLYLDGVLLDNATAAGETARKIRYKNNGDTVSAVDDCDSEMVLDTYAARTISDGTDLAQTAAVALLEQAAEHAGESGWLEKPYTVRRLSKRVYINLSDSAAYTEVETTSIQETYRAVRRAVETTRAVTADPRSKYCYIEDLATAEDGETAADVVYYRLNKYADLGGYEAHSNIYTADMETATVYMSLLERLNLTDRQATIVKLRGRGYGNTAIATYLGVTPRCIEITVKRIREKCEKIGFTPEMWREMNE